MKIVFTIAGPPRTKKNHGRRIWREGRAYHVPSEAHERWYADTQGEAFRIKADIRLAHGSIDLPILDPVNVRATFWRERATGDLINYCQALADWLEGVGILENDQQILAWDGTRMAKDKTTPRIEVEIKTWT